MIRSVFISGASEEFGAIRGQLAADLRKKGIATKEQADFCQGPATLMDQLFYYIDTCDAVLALQGCEQGSRPTACHCLDVFGYPANSHFEALAEESGIPMRLMPLSYTQWELAYALGFRLGAKRKQRKPVFLYVTQELADALSKEGGGIGSDTAEPSWEAFGSWLYELGVHMDVFPDDSALRLLVMRDLTPNVAPESATHVLPGIPTPLRVKPTVKQVQWETAWELGHSIYCSLGMGDLYPPKDHALNWWRKFNRGAIAVLDNEEKLWGYLSIWPLTHEAFESIRMGTLGEQDLCPRHLEEDPDYFDGEARDVRNRKGDAFPGFRYWYVADLCLATHDRASWGPLRMPFNLMRRNARTLLLGKVWEFLIKFLLYESLGYLYAERLLAEEVMIIAFGESQFGCKWLGITHFEQQTTSAREHGFPIYLRCTSATALRREIAAFRQAPDYLRRLANLQQGLASYHNFAGGSP